MLVLMGDSHAGQWFPAVAEAFHRPGWRLLVLSKSSCPMVDEPFFYGRIGKEYTVCATWRAHAVETVAKLKPDVVLLGTVDTYGFSENQWIAGTESVLKQLSLATGHIYLLRDTPHLPFDGPDCLAEHVGRPAWLGLGHACQVASADAQGALVYQWLGVAASRFTNVSRLDMNAYICPEGICSAKSRGMVVFRDSQHMTGSFAATLGPALAMKLGLGAGAPGMAAGKGAARP